MAANFTTSLTTSVFNELRGFQWSEDSEPGTAYSPNPEGVVRQAGQQVLLVGRNSFSPRETTINRYQGADAVTFLNGSHVLKAGFDFNKDTILNYFPGNFFGSYTFASIANYNKGSRLPHAGLPGSRHDGAGNASGSDGLRRLRAGRMARDAETDAQPRASVRLQPHPAADRVELRPPAAGGGAADGHFPTRTPTTSRRASASRIHPPTGRYCGPPTASSMPAPSILYGTATSNNGVNVQTLTFTTGVPTYPAVFPSIPVGATIPQAHDLRSRPAVAEPQGPAGKLRGRDTA